MPVLELKNIRKSYFLGKDEFPVLKGLTLSLSVETLSAYSASPVEVNQP